jgi:hypothetical protein
MRRSILILVAAVLMSAAVARSAAARSAGIAGYSGKDDFFCTECHDMETRAAPTVRFIDVPTQVDPGTVVTVQFGVRPNETRLIAAGLDVAASAGELQVGTDSGVHRQRFSASAPYEITHNEPRDLTDGEAVWSFTWTAPATPGQYILFGAGNSVDLSLDESGDASAKTMLVINVGDVAPTPTVTPTATPVPASCTGDCNNDGAVTINELISGVNIALGNAAVSTCPSFDASGDGSVTINELIAAVNSALSGC